MKIALPKIRFRYIVAVALLCYIGYGVYRYIEEERDVVRLEMPGFNPSFYDFPVPMDSVMRAVRAIKYGTLYIAKQRGPVITQKGYVFKLKKHFISPTIYSYIYQYRKKDEHIRISYDLEVRLKPLGPDSTRVMTYKINHTAWYGVDSWKNLRFTSYYHKEHEVHTPVIEEYEFLRVLGKQLGHLDSMPYVKYPIGLSREKIIDIFEGNLDHGVENPFTEEEMFGEMP